ncbi:hypothetical protein JW823_03045 [bacterium]|nr:hypothetical protein [candidate division CSSED10-310 bacterium]
MDRRMTAIWILLFGLYFFSTRFCLDGYELEYVLSAMNVYHGHGPSLAPGFEGCPGILPTTGNVPVFPRQNLLQTYLSVPFYALGAIIFGEEPICEEKGGFWKLPWGPVVVVSMLNPMMAALIAVLVGLIARDLGTPNPLHYILAVLFGVTSMNWHYGALGMEVVQTGLLMVALWAAIRFRFTGGRGWLIAASLLLFLLPLCKKITFVFMAPIVVYLLWSLSQHDRKRGRTALVFIGLGVSAGLLIMSAFMLYRFHADPNLFPHYLRTYLTEGQPFINLLFGLTLSPGEGIIPFNPLIVFGFLAWPGFFRAYRSESFLFAGIFAALFVMLGIIPYVLIDEEWGPRYLFILLPLIYIIGAKGLMAFKPGNARKLLIVVLILSIAIQWLSSMYLGFKILEIPLSMGISDYTLCIFTPSLSQIWLAAACFVSHIHSLLTGESLVVSHNEFSSYIGAGNNYRELKKDLTLLDDPAGGVFTVRWALSEKGIHTLTPIKAFALKILGDLILLSCIAVLSIRSYREYAVISTESGSA